RIAKKSEYLYLQIDNKSNEIKSVAKFATNQNEVFFSQDNAKITCERVEPLAKKLKKTSLLTQYNGHLGLKLGRNLEFKFDRRRSADKMSYIYFQNGIAFHNKAMKKQAADWCILKVKLLHSADTIVNKGTKIPVVNMDLFSMGENANVYNFNFLDFEKAKAKFKTFSMVPLSLDCRLSDQNPFTYGRFNGITGNYLDFEVTD
ncbi:MAG: hypothetical protein ACOCUH_01820, partial [Bacteriovoracia bacterium]